MQYFFIRVLVGALFLSTISYSQNKYEVFKSANHYGIVKTDSLREYLPPKKRSLLFINKDVFAFYKKDSITIFNKKTGKWMPSLRWTVFPSVNITNNKYLLANSKGKLHLYDSTLQILHTFKKDYKSVKKIFNRTNFLALSIDNKIDLFQLHKNGRELKFEKYFKAPFSLRTVNASGNSVIVFYGDAQTHVFDVKGNYTVYEKQFNEDNRMGIYELLDPSSSDEEYEVMIDDTPYVEEELDPKQFQFNGIVNGKNTYSAPAYNFVISVNKGYAVRENQNGFITVMTKEVDGNRTTYRGNGFSFYLDIAQLRALIPMKYQEIMGLVITPQSLGSKK